MDVGELKQIQLFRQHLTNPADKITVVRDLCGVQAQFMANALHSLKIRCTDFDGDSGGLVKNWTIRGTVHVFAEADLPLFVHTSEYRSNNWHEDCFWNQRENWSLTPERQAYLSEILLSALQKQPQTRDGLKEICRGAGMTPAEEESMFHPWGGGIRQLCERGFLNYTVEEEKRFCLAPEFVPMAQAEAELEICRRYLHHMAPATIQDICYYLKCSQRQAKAWISQLPVKSFVIDKTEYFYLGELADDYPDVPNCLFLAGFDQLMLAYEKQTSIYLPREFLRGIFNLTGIVMPAILLNGVVCGKWKKTKGKLEITCFRDFTAAEKRVISAGAEALFGDGFRTLSWQR